MLTRQQQSLHSTTNNGRHAGIYEYVGSETAYNSNIPFFSFPESATVVRVDEEANTALLTRQQQNLHSTTNNGRYINDVYMLVPKLPNITVAIYTMYIYICWFRNCPALLFFLYLKEGRWLISIIQGSSSSSIMRSIPIIVKHVDGGGGGGGGVGVPPPLPPAPPPLGFPLAAAEPPGIGLAMLYSRRSIGPTVMRVLTQASASRPHIA